MKKVTFKRKALINRRVTLNFILFIIISTLIVGYFLIEDYNLNLKTKTSLTDYGDRVVTDGILGNPVNYIVIGLWLLSCTVFSLAFNTRLKPMFSLFFWLSFVVVIIFVSWNYLVAAALDSVNNRFISLISHIDYSSTTKTILLLFWGFFSIFISFSYVTTKYMGILSRLDYLFNSIERGNWDSIMFFRTGDQFAFLATTFNELKDSYLKKIYSTDEVLIQIKDTLSGQNKLSMEQKTQITELLKKNLNENI